MKKIIFQTLVLGIIVFGVIYYLSLEYQNRPKDVNKKAEVTYSTVEPEFDIITTHGTMRIKLYHKTPKHKGNFVKLVKENYYDSVMFHRIIEDFMIQTGDPLSKDTSLVENWGTGGPEYVIPAEFVEEYHHKKGAIAAARRGDVANPNKASSGSQFYIVHDENECRHLDGEYTVFGEVIDGLEVVDAIANERTDKYDRPIGEVMIKTIIPVVAEPEDEAIADSTIVETPVDKAE